MMSLDVVALERHRERGERADHRVARRERVGVAVDLARLVVAGHRHHAEVGRAAAPGTPTRSSSKYGYGSSTSDSSVKKSIVFQSLNVSRLP